MTVSTVMSGPIRTTNRLIPQLPRAYCERPGKILMSGLGEKGGKETIVLCASYGVATASQPSGRGERQLEGYPQ